MKTRRWLVSQGGREREVVSPRFPEFSRFFHCGDPLQATDEKKRYEKV